MIVQCSGTYSGRNNGFKQVNRVEQCWNSEDFHKAHPYWYFTWHLVPYHSSIGLDGYQPADLRVASFTKTSTAILLPPETSTSLSKCIFLYITLIRSAQRSSPTKGVFGGSFILALSRITKNWFYVAKQATHEIALTKEIWCQLHPPPSLRSGGPLTFPKWSSTERKQRAREV